MQIISQGIATRPGGLALQDKTRNPINRRPNIAVHGTAGDNRDLQRLESFFGADSPYVARRHHRDNRWVDSSETQDANLPDQPDAKSIADNITILVESPSPQVPVIDTEKLLEAPTAALERLTELTSQQLTNLQTASQQAGDILNEFKGTAEAGAGRLFNNLEDAQRKLTPEIQSQVEKISTVLESQVNEAQDVLMNAVEAIKKQAQTISQQINTQLDNPSAPPSSSSVVAKQQKPQTTTASGSTTSTAEESVARRFKTEMQQIVEKVQSLSEVQVKNVQHVVVDLERDLVDYTNQLRSFISEKRVELNKTLDQLNATKPQQQQQQNMKKAPVTRTEVKTPPAQQQKQSQLTSSPSSHVSTPVQHITKTAEAVKDIWQEKVKTLRNNINLPSVSVPAPLTNFDASKLKSVAANNPQAVAVGAGILAVSALRLFLRSRANKGVDAEQNAIKRARSRRALDRQRNRFKQALGNDEEGSGGVDSSVFAAVQRIQSSSAAAASAAAAAANSAGNGNNSSDDDDDDEEEEDNGGALGSDPDSWDPAMKKQWNAFVNNSKLKDASLWDPTDIDEGLPEIYVDLDRE